MKFDLSGLIFFNKIGLIIFAEYIYASQALEGILYLKILIDYLGRLIYKLFGDFQITTHC